MSRAGKSGVAGLPTELRASVAKAERVGSVTAVSLPELAAGPVEILLCASAGYFQHAAVVAVSALESCAARSIRITVLTCDADGVAKSWLRTSLAPYPHARLEIHRNADRQVEGLFVDRHITKEAYLRFLAPEILPLEVQRVIYLDCDLVVTDDIGKLWLADLGGKATGAVAECDWTEATPGDMRLAELGIAPGQTYVNSGVLVMDLAKWRRDGLCRKVLDCARRLGAGAAYHDQDALNLALGGDIALLDRRWNVQTLMLGRQYRKLLPRDHEASQTARQAPGIVHFSTADKPWKFRSWTRRRALYFRYLDKTAWKAAVPAGLTGLQRAEYRLSRLALRAGVDINGLAGLIRRAAQLANRRPAVAARKRAAKG